MKVLVLNSGSSSIKAAVIDPQSGDAPFTALAERLGEPEARLNWTALGAKESAALAPGCDHHGAMTALPEKLDQTVGREGLIGVGHRVVHGCEAFTGSVALNDEVLAAVTANNHLAPLHNPANLAGIRAAMATFGELPQVGVFDTAFHQTMPAKAYHYAVPYALYQDHGVRRYGFHGTSHRFVAAEAARRLQKPAKALALVTCHLGNGCSLAAVNGGVSVDTTMGLTPLEGVVMGTRSGDVDPGLHAFLTQKLDLDIESVTTLLNKKSGLLGLSGLSNDMRTLLEAADSGHKRAELAVDVFCYRLAKAIGAMAVALPRLDALVFTGGIGEHAAPIRARTVAQLAVLGLALDAQKNSNNGDSEGRIDTPQSPAILVIPTNEELVIARDTAAIVAERSQS